MHITGQKLFSARWASRDEPTWSELRRRRLRREIAWTAILVAVFLSTVILLPCTEV